MIPRGLGACQEPKGRMSLKNLNPLDIISAVHPARLYLLPHLTWSPRHTRRRYVRSIPPLLLYTTSVPRLLDGLQRNAVCAGNSGGVSAATATRPSTRRPRWRSFRPRQTSRALPVPARPSWALLRRHTHRRRWRPVGSRQAAVRRLWPHEVEK